MHQCSMELLPVVHLSKESFKLDGLARSTPNAGNPCIPLVGCDGSERTYYDARGVLQTSRLKY